MSKPSSSRSLPLFDDLPSLCPDSAAIPNLTLTIDEAIRLAIDLELRKGPKAAADLVRGLTQSGIGVQASLTGNGPAAGGGRLAGFRFKLKEVSFKGSELGKDYTLAGLTARGLEYDPACSAELKAALAQQAGPYRPALAEIISWPDRIEPGTGASVSSGPSFRAGFRSFVKEHNLLYWWNKNDSAVVFYHRSMTPKGERAGMAFVARGSALDVRIALDQNIQAALRFGLLKWGSVAVVGAPAFVARAEAWLQRMES